MSKNIFSIIILGTMFSCIVMANPWIKKRDLPKSDFELIQRLYELTNGCELDYFVDDESDIEFINYQEVIPRLLKSDSIDEDVLEKIIVAIKYSKYPVENPEKYLFKILNHKVATDKTYKNLLTFLKSYQYVVERWQDLTKMIISKTNDHRILVDSVSVLLYSSSKRVTGAEYQLKLVLAKLQGDYRSMCHALHALQNYRKGLDSKYLILDIDVLGKLIDDFRKEMSISATSEVFVCPNL